MRVAVSTSTGSDSSTRTASSLTFSATTKSTSGTRSLPGTSLSPCAFSLPGVNSTINPATTPSTPVDGVDSTQPVGSALPSRVAVITRKEYETPLRRPLTVPCVAGPGIATVFANPCGPVTSI